MSEQEEETVIPLGVVVMSVGLIVIGTAVAIYFLLPQAAPEVIELVQPASLPTPEPTEEVVALMPETPNEADEESIVTVAELAQSYVAGKPERIVIDDIDLDAPITDIGLAQVQSNGQTYYQWQVPAQFLAGWHNTSAPLGEPGNTVLNGHHNIHGEVFRNLVDLEEGAQILMYDEQDVYTYTVSLIEILPERDQPLSVRIENAKFINPTEDERITLVTCWPYEDNSHRLVVVAEPADTISEEPSITPSDLEGNES